MEKKIIVANWKMNPPSLKEAKVLFNSAIKKIKKTESEVVFCLPFIYFSVFEKAFSGIKLGAQDCFWREAGAFTGEVSAKQLSLLGCGYIIAGHSERRKYFGETNEIVNSKIKAILEAGLTPILCIGETQEQRDRGEEQKVLENQIEAGLSKISPAKMKDNGFWIAYEPVWAIGTGRPCDSEEAQKMMLFIRKIVFGLYPHSVAKKIKILYGGSVNSKNAESYIRDAGYNGLLVGGASLDDEEFSKIVRL